MAFNLLGEEKSKPIKKRRENVEIILHRPKEEAKQEIKVEVKKKKEKPIKPVRIFRLPFSYEVNLITYFKKYLLKRRLTFCFLFVIIVSGLSVYFLFFYKPKPKIVVNKNINTNINVPFSPTPVVTPPKTPTPSPIPTPSPTPIIIPTITPTPPIILPDTELALLRGTLVKFSGEATIYLIEYNGELRKVDLNSVSFADGERARNLSASKIYVISDRYKTVRRGKDVFGKVEWDPRILTPLELQSFL